MSLHGAVAFANVKLEGQRTHSVCYIASPVEQGPLCEIQWIGVQAGSELLSCARDMHTTAEASRKHLGPWDVKQYGLKVASTLNTMLLYAASMHCKCWPKHKFAYSASRHSWVKQAQFVWRFEKR